MNSKLTFRMAAADLVPHFMTLQRIEVKFLMTINDTPEIRNTFGCFSNRGNDFEILLLLIGPDPGESSH